MKDKLKNLELKKLLQEFHFLEVDKEFKDEFIEFYKPLFMKEVQSKKTSEQRENEINKTPPQPNENKNDEIKPKNIFNVSEDELDKIKKIFREIVKICHPDKSGGNQYINEYLLAKEAYEKNDLLTLYTISTKLNIIVDIDEDNVFLLKRNVEQKRKELLELEKSFLWLWVHSQNDFDKDKIIEMFIQQNLINQ
jgi:hypothetical protein